MAASYPSTYKSFIRNQDNVDVVFADDVNDAYDEIVAMQHALGLNVHTSTDFPSATTLAERLILSEDLLTTLAGYFDGSGNIASSKVTGLAASLATLQANIDAEATARTNAINAAVSTLNTAITAEATARASGDTSLSTALGSEATTRAAAVTSLTGQINALGVRTTDIEHALRKQEGEVIRNSNRSCASSASYADLLFNSTAFFTNDYSSELNGAYDTSVGRLYTGHAETGTDQPSVWALAASITFLGGNTVGLRGLRLLTSGGTVLCETIKNANNDSGDQTLSVAWTGRLTNADTYYVKVQLLQNSGSTLTLRAHSSTTPTMLWWTRLPSSVGGSDPGSSL